jgi:hypothetical protein
MNHNVEKIEEARERKREGDFLLKNLFDCKPLGRFDFVVKKLQRNLPQSQIEPELRSQRWENSVFLGRRGCSKTTLSSLKTVRKLFIDGIKFFVYANSSLKRSGLNEPAIKVSYEALKICRRRHKNYKGVSFMKKLISFLVLVMIIAGSIFAQEKKGYIKPTFGFGFGTASGGGDIAGIALSFDVDFVISIGITFGFQDLFIFSDLGLNLLPSIEHVEFLRGLLPAIFSL